MGTDSKTEYIPKYIKLDAILSMLLNKLNLEIEENAINLVAQYFDKKIETAAAELATKFK